MNCSKCGERTQIFDTRYTSYGVRRRHKCTACDNRLVSVEITREVYNALLKIQKEHKAIIDFFAMYSKDEKGGVQE